jgi:hypothetical protein
MIIASCAKMPIETLTLTDAVINEGKRMHQLNSELLNKMFKEKKERIDIFMRDEYTPQYIDNFKSLVPDTTNYKQEFANMMKSIIPVINTRRDNMQSALENQRIKVMTKLDEDYRVFLEASMALRNLIESNIKVNEERRKAFEQVSELTQNKIDLNKIEAELDKYILQAGDIGGNVIDMNNALNNSINSILNN